MKALIILICSITQLLLSATPLNADDPCLLIKDDCPKCIGTSGCAFWYCQINDVPTNETQCEYTGSKKPAPCTNGGKWHKLETPHDSCPKPNSTTTTTTTTTIPTTTTITTTTTTTSPTNITPDPKTSTLTTSKSTTTMPITIPSTTSTDLPHSEAKEKLTAWTIVGIVGSSLLVVIVLVAVAWKKVGKLYQTRNPYRSFQ